MTDNRNEYDILMEEIPEFFKEWYNHKEGEKLYMISFNGNIYENYKKGGEVEVPEDAKIEGEENGLLLSMHNHTNGCSFQSMEDYETMIKINEKYKISLSTDGITVSKMTNLTNNLLYTDVKKSYSNYWSKLTETIEQNKHNNGFNEIIEQLQNGKISEKEFSEHTKQIFLNHLNENSEEETRRLTNQFKKDKINITVIHLNIKKVYE